MRESNAAVGRVAVLCIVATGIVGALAQPLNHDAAWILYGAREMLGGAQLYVDIIEINPPLIYWLSLPVIMLERAGIPHTLGFPLLVGLGAAASLVASHRLTRQAFSGTRVVFLIVLAIAFFIVPGKDWGQREHLMVLLTTPYIVTCAIRARGGEPARPWAVGIPAGLGFALKPHFLIALPALELWLYVSRARAWRTAFVAAGTVVAYGLIVLVFVPEYLLAALDLRTVYSGFVGNSTRDMVSDPRTLAATLAILTVVIRGQGRELRCAFAIATAAWLLALFSQGKGFGYHYLPGLMGTVVLLPLALGRAALPVAIGLAIALGMRNPGADARWPEIREVDRLLDNGRIVILTPHVSGVWPHVSYADATWAAPIPAMWPTLSDGYGSLDLNVRWILPALRAGVPVLVPNHSYASALPDLLEHADFRTAWTAYASTERGDYYTLFTATKPPIVRTPDNEWE